MVGNVFLSGTALEPLACQQNVDGSSTMTSAPHIKCTLCPLPSNSTFAWYDEYQSLHTQAIVCTTLYGLGSPLLFFTVLYTHRHVLKKNEFQNGFGFLSTKMREEYYFWEVIITLRKLLLVCGAKLFSKENKSPGALWIVSVTVCSLVAQVQATPFASALLHHHRRYSSVELTWRAACTDKDANIAESCMLLATMLVPILALGQRSCASWQQPLHIV